jgi:hypothetical protein
MNNEQYYYNGEPLQLSYNNTYSMADKIEIISNIQTDFKNGMLSWTQMFWIIDNAKFGSWTCQNIVDKLIFEGKLKKNPITLDKRTFNTIRKPFDL